jgi:hypothetical protein
VRSGVVVVMRVTRLVNVVGCIIILTGTPRDDGETEMGRDDPRKRTQNRDKRKRNTEAINSREKNETTATTTTAMP